MSNRSTGIESSWGGSPQKGKARSLELHDDDDDDVQSADIV